MYENGWKKKLTYVLAFNASAPGGGRDGAVVDVTRRYTRRWADVLARRGETAECARFVVVHTMWQVEIRKESIDVSLLGERGFGLSMRDDKRVHARQRRQKNAPIFRELEGE